MNKHELDLINEKKLELTEQLVNDLNNKVLPEDVRISTITVFCKLGVEFNLYNIAKYIELRSERVVKVSYGKNGDVTTNRSLNKRRKKKKQKKKNNVFYNQVSLCTYIESKKDKPINIKIFSNGSIQMTGCRGIENTLDALECIFDELRQVRGIVCAKTFKIVDKPFVNDISKLNLLHVDKIKVAMINTNFKFPERIDRLKLYKLLLSQNHLCKFDPKQHACVNIKHQADDKTVSIFVFEKGSIVITGAKNCNHINSAYIFINQYLLNNLQKIIKTPLNDSDIKNFMNDDEDIIGATEYEDEMKYDMIPQVKIKRGRKKKTKVDNDEDVFNEFLENLSDNDF